MEDFESLSEKIARIREQTETKMDVKTEKASKPEKKTTKKSKASNDIGAGEMKATLDFLKSLRPKSAKEKFLEFVASFFCAGVVVAILIALVFLLIALGRWVFSF